MKRLNLSEHQLFELLKKEKEVKEQNTKEAFLEYTEKKLCSKDR